MTKVAIKDPKLLWRLARWGCERSYKPAEILLVLEIILEDRIITRDYIVKATTFA